MRRILMAILMAVSLGGCVRPAPPSKTTAALVKDAAVAPPPVVAEEARFRLTGGIVPHDAQEVAQFLSAVYQGGGRHAILEIDSPGGRADVAREIGHLLGEAARGGLVVDCLVDGHAASAAFYVLQSCPPGRRAMTAPSISATDDVAFENFRAAMRAEAAAWATHCAARLKVTRKDYDERTRAGRQWFMTAAQAVEYGAVDVVLP